MKRVIGKCDQCAHVENVKILLLVVTINLSNNGKGKF